MPEFLNRSETRFSEQDGSVVTPRIFERFVFNPKLLNAAGGLTTAPKHPDKLSVMTRVLIFYGEEGLRKRFIIDNPPVNPKTGKPYGTDTQKYQDWCTSLGVPPERISSTEDLVAARNLVKLIEACPAWPITGENHRFGMKHSEQDTPEIAKVKIVAKDVVRTMKYKDLALLGYCDWVYEFSTSRCTQYVPAYFVVVGSLNNPVPELSARGKFWEAAFTEYCLNANSASDLPQDCGLQPIYLLAEMSPAPRVGVYTFSLTLTERHSRGPFEPVDPEFIQLQLDDYIQQKQSGIWLTRFETPKGRNVVIYD